MSLGSALTVLWVQELGGVKYHCATNRNQTAEDLIRDLYHVEDFACRGSHRKTSTKCFDVLLEKVEGDGDCL